MFGIGSTELIVILLVALIALGPKNLAGFAKKLGKWAGEFRRMSTEFHRALNVEAAREEAKEAEAKRRESHARAETEDLVKSSERETETKVNLLKDPEKPADDGIFGVPPDSPVARTLAKAKAEADAAERDVALAMREAKSDKKGDAAHGF